LHGVVQEGDLWTTLIDDTEELQRHHHTYTKCVRYCLHCCAFTMCWLYILYICVWHFHERGSTEVQVLVQC